MLKRELMHVTKYNYFVCGYSLDMEKQQLKFDLLLCAKVPLRKYVLQA